MRSFRRLRVRAGRKGSTSPISGCGQRRERRAANGGTTKRRIRAGGQPIKPARTARSTAAKAAGAHARTGNDGAKWHPRNRTGNTKPPTRGGATAPHKAAAGGKRKHRTGNTHLPTRGCPPRRRPRRTEAEHREPHLPISPTFAERTTFALLDIGNVISSECQNVRQSDVVKQRGKRI